MCFTCIFTWEISPVKIHMGNFPMWLFPCGKVTCEISHVKFPMWSFPCEISHVKFHIRLFTCEISHVKSHMWNFTRETSREISYVIFHMWYFTCEIPQMKSHVEFVTWESFPMWFFKSDSKCCRIRTCRTNSSRYYVWVKLYIRNLLWSNVENIFVSDWKDTIVRLQSHAVKRLLMYCFNS